MSLQTNHINTLLLLFSFIARINCLRVENFLFILFFFPLLPSIILLSHTLFVFLTFFHLDVGISLLKYIHLFYRMRVVGFKILQIMDLDTEAKNLFNNAVLLDISND